EGLDPPSQRSLLAVPPLRRTGWRSLSVFCPWVGPPPRPSLLPYTTLFRSGVLDVEQSAHPHALGDPEGRLADPQIDPRDRRGRGDRKSTRLNSSHVSNSYAVFCLRKKKGRMRSEPVHPAHGAPHRPARRSR